MNSLKYFLVLLIAMSVVACKKTIQDSNSAISLGVNYKILKKTYKETEADNNLLWIETIYYDKNNLLIQTTSGTKYTQFNADAKTLYQYNNEKRVTKFETFRKWNPTENFQKLYDTIYLFEDGRTKTKTIHDFENNVSAVVEFSYDFNRLIKEDIKGSLPAYYHYWNEYEYNATGKTVKKEVYNDLGLQRTFLYEYFNERLSKERIIYNGWETDFIEYSYDGDNLIKIEKFERYTSGPFVRYALDEFFYDDGGRITREIRRNSRVSFDPPIFKYVVTYEYRFM